MAETEPSEKSARLLEATAEMAKIRHRLGPDAAHLLDHAFHALRHGRRIAPAELGKRFSWDARRVEAAVAQARRRGLGTMDDDGLLTGSWGLTVEPTRHRLTLDGQPLHAWCAMDAVGIPAALQADATIESRLDADDTPLTIQIRSGHVTAVNVPDVVIAIPTARLDKAIRQTICPRINFHRRAAAPNHPEIAVFSLDEAVRAGRALWATTAQAAENPEENA